MDKRYTGLCGLCIPKGKVVESCSYCSRCCTHLCQTCSRNHGNVCAVSLPKKPTRCQTADAILRSVGGVKSVQRPSFSARGGTIRLFGKQAEFARCVKHPEHNVENFCERHDSVMCEVCLNLEHPDCTVRPIDEVAANENVAEEAKEVVEELRRLREMCQHRLDQETSVLHQIQHMSNAIEDKFLRQRENLVSEINNCTNELLGRKDQIVLRQKSEAEQSRRLFQELGLRLDMSLQSAVNVTDRCTPAYFVALHNCKEVIKECKLNLDQKALVEQKTVCIPTFEDTLLQNLIAPRKLHAITENEVNDKNANPDDDNDDKRKGKLTHSKPLEQQNPNILIIGQKELHEQEASSHSSSPEKILPLFSESTAPEDILSCSTDSTKSTSPRGVPRKTLKPRLKNYPAKQPLFQKQTHQGKIIVNDDYLFSAFSSTNPSRVQSAPARDSTGEKNVLTAQRRPASVFKRTRKNTARSARLSCGGTEVMKTKVNQMANHSDGMFDKVQRKYGKENRDGSGDALANTSSLTEKDILDIEKLLNERTFPGKITEAPKITSNASPLLAKDATYIAFSSLEQNPQSAKERNKKALQYATPARMKLVPHCDQIVRLQSDAQLCEISGMDCMPDGRLVISDTANSCLKVFDQYGTKGMLLRLPDPPQSVACISNTSIAVISGLAFDLLLLVNVDQELVVRKSFKTRTSCRAVAATESHIYLLCIRKYETELSILNPDGVVSLRINLGHIISAPKDVAVSRTSGKIYVVDAKSGVYVIDSKGPKIKCCVDGNIDRYLGLAVDLSENVYVCTGNPDGVYEVSYDWRYLMPILLGNQASDLAVMCYNVAENKLILGRSPTETVSVYKPFDMLRWIHS